MRFLPLAAAALALSLGAGPVLAECGAHQAKASNEVASTKPLVERLIALAAKQGVEVKTQ